MEIDKEKFNKLKQLDRIEYRQKLNRIEKEEGGMFDFVLALMIISTIFLTGAVIIQEFGRFSLTLYEAGTNTMYFAMFLFIIHIIFKMVQHYRQYKLKEKLEKEYFKIEVKK